MLMRGSFSCTVLGVRWMRSQLWLASRSLIAEVCYFFLPPPFSNMSLVLSRGRPGRKDCGVELLVVCDAARVQSRRRRKKKKRASPEQTPSKLSYNNRITAPSFPTPFQLFPTLAVIFRPLFSRQISTRNIFTASSRGDFPSRVIFVLVFFNTVFLKEHSAFVSKRPAQVILIAIIEIPVYTNLNKSPQKNGRKKGIQKG